MLVHIGSEAVLVPLVELDEVQLVALLPHLIMYQLVVAKVQVVQVERVQVHLDKVVEEVLKMEEPEVAEATTVVLELHTFLEVAVVHHIFQVI